MPSLICVNSKVFTGHTPLVIHQVGFDTEIIFLIRAVNEWSCIGKVGVDLELCVNAHGHDVDLIMEASLIIKWSLGISSSCICKLILCNRGPDRDCSSLIPCRGQLKHLFCKSICLSNPYIELSRVLPPYCLEDIILLYYAL